MTFSKSFSIIAFAFALFFSFQVNAQKFSKLDKSPLDISYYKASRNEAPMIKVVYSRPQLKERSLATLAPNDKVWRTGANEATEIKLYQDTTIGGDIVKAGTYSLFTIPGETEWTIILNNDLDVWGAYSYNKANDVARFKVKKTTANKSIEAFSIAFDKGQMVMAWDKTRINIPVSVKK